MNIQEAKTIRLADYLQSLGYLPVKQQGNNLWYKSPFRQETEASFKVSMELVNSVSEKGAILNTNHLQKVYDMGKGF